MRIRLTTYSNTAWTTVAQPLVGVLSGIAIVASHSQNAHKGLRSCEGGLFELHDDRIVRLVLRDQR